VKLGTRKITSWFFWAGLAFTVAGFACYFGNYSWFRTRTWSVVRVPMLLEPGSKSTEQFTPNITERFLIQLEVDRDTPADLSEKVLGIGDLASGNLGRGQGFKVQWLVFENGKLLKQGLSDGNGEGYWSAKKGRILGVFPAQKGRTYWLETNVLEDGSALLPFHPTLRVAVDIFTLDGYAIGEGFAELTGFILAGLGLALIAVSILVWSLRLTQRPKPLPSEN
jgi:hypothetical protein